MIVFCCIPPAILLLLLAWVGFLISAERQGGSRALTISGWTCFGLAVAMVAVPAALALVAWIGSWF